jgi:hypothetical protein
MKCGPGCGAPHAVSGRLRFTMCGVHSGVSEDTNRGTARVRCRRNLDECAAIVWGIIGRGARTILGPTNRYSNKKRMWPSCVERYTPKPVSQ